MSPYLTYYSYSEPTSLLLTLNRGVMWRNNFYFQVYDLTKPGHRGEYGTIEAVLLHSSLKLIWQQRHDKLTFTKTDVQMYGQKRRSENKYPLLPFLGEAYKMYVWNVLFGTGLITWYQFHRICKKFIKTDNEQNIKMYTILTLMCNELFLIVKLKIQLGWMKRI